MRLDERTFAEVILALGAIIGPDEDLRRRRAKRYHSTADVIVAAAGVVNPVPRRVKLANISATGVCIIDWMNLSSGDRLVVSLPRPRGAMLRVMCTVRQSRLTGTGSFRAGAEFTGEAELEDRLVSGVSGVLAKAPNLGEEEARIPARCAVQWGSAPGQVFDAVVREMRNETMVLYTPAQITPGTALIVELHPGRPERRVLQGVVQDVLTTGSDQFRLLVRRGAIPLLKRPLGLFRWLRGR